jgi:DNA replication protein DnaC
MSVDFEVRIDQHRDEFEILRQKQKKIYRLTDSTSIEIQEQQSIGLYRFDFEARIERKKGSQSSTPEAPAYTPDN